MTEQQQCYYCVPTTCWVLKTGSYYSAHFLFSSGGQVFGERGHCNLSPPPSLLVGFLVVQLVHLLRWMLTVQNSKKSWLPMKSTCRCLADDATLGLRLPPSGSGCPRVPVTREGNGPVCSWLALLSFILCVGLMVSSVQFILSVLSNSLRPHELQYARPSCPSTTPGVHPNSYAWSR